MIELTTGWTKPITFTLYNGATVVDLTATTVLMVIQNSAGVAVTTTGDAVLGADPTTGKVVWSPDLADLPSGRYRLRIEVTDSQGISYFPNGAAENLMVYAQ